MSTPTPTGDGVSDVPPWVPDEATLTKLANEFFGAMPGHEPRQVRSEEAQKTEPVFRAASEPSTYESPADTGSVFGDDVRGYQPPDLLLAISQGGVGSRAFAVPWRAAGTCRGPWAAPGQSCGDPCLHGLSPAGAGVATG